jgi:hypothetical protein
MITKEMGKILNDYAEQKGVYDASLTIEQENKWLELVQDMANLIEEVTEENKKKVDVIELPMPYVLTMLDALQAIKKYKLYGLMSGGKDEEDHIDVVIEEFLEPLAMSTDDVEIVFYD